MLNPGPKTAVKLMNLQKVYYLYKIKPATTSGQMIDNLQVPPPTEVLLVVHSCQGEKYFHFEDVALVGSSCSSGWTGFSLLSEQNKT